MKQKEYSIYKYIKAKVEEHIRDLSGSGDVIIILGDSGISMVTGEMTLYSREQRAKWMLAGI